MTNRESELQGVIRAWNACHDVPLDPNDQIQVRAVVVWAVAIGLMHQPSNDELLRQWTAEKKARLRDALKVWHSRN